MNLHCNQTFLQNLYRPIVGSITITVGQITQNKFKILSNILKIAVTQYLNPLPPDRHYCDDASTNDMLVNLTFSAHFLYLSAAQNASPAGGRPVHFMLQTNRKSVQKS